VRRTVSIVCSSSSPSPTAIESALLQGFLPKKGQRAPARFSTEDEIARREHLDKRSVRRLLRLGFLSPRIIEAIAEGHQSPDLTVFSLMRRVDLPLLWNAQEQALGFR
jgi:hypothetical protein